MRCFIAVEVPAEVRDAIVRVQDALRRADADVKWVERENLHLTLKFIADLGDATALSAALAAIRAPATRLDFRGLGLFPRVIWAGCEGGLAILAEDVERAAETAGVPREGRPFTPHLTIGRVKSRRNEKRLRDLIEARGREDFGAADVASFALVKSTLTPKGPVYETLRVFPLG